MNKSKQKQNKKQNKTIFNTNCVFLLPSLLARWGNRKFVLTDVNWKITTKDNLMAKLSNQFSSKENQEEYLQQELCETNTRLTLARTQRRQPMRTLRDCLLAETGVVTGVGGCTRGEGEALCRSGGRLPCSEV